MLNNFISMKQIVFKYWGEIKMAAVYLACLTEYIVIVDSDVN